MSNLGTAYSALGRHQDALVMKENALQFLRRVLPENQPAIGATRLCLFYLRVISFVPGNVMSSMANIYSAAGRHQDALVMKEKALQFLRRALPENHPDICASRSCLFIYVLFHAFCSRRGNEQSRQHVLGTWAAPRCSGIDREDA